jgi:hypothetical protein
MKCKCSVCDFIFIFDNTPENNDENNRISCEHLNSHKDKDHVYWIDLDNDIIKFPEPPEPVNASS